MGDKYSLFRKIAFIEGCSYLLFGLTMPLKYFLKILQPNLVVGIVHGLLFIAYCLLLLQVWIEYNWKFKRAFLAFLVSLLPFGTFWAEKRDWFSTLK